MTQRLVENTLHTLAHFRLYRLRVTKCFSAPAETMMPFVKLLDSFCTETAVRRRSA